MVIKIKSKQAKNKGMQKLSSILDQYKPEEGRGYISKEFQDYGYRLALEMEDLKRTSMYIKFAKTMDRSLLEQARSFVKDAPNVKSKSRLFMWKIAQIKKDKLL